MLQRHFRGASNVLNYDLMIALSNAFLIRKIVIYAEYFLNI